MVNAQRRRYQRTRGDDALCQHRKSFYEEAKRGYQTTIQQEKIKSWKEYCSITTITNPRNAMYKIASGKIRNSCTLSTLRKGDGTYTKGLADTMNHMMNQFTQDDDEERDNEYHRHIRLTTNQPPSTYDDILFIEEKIRDVIDRMDDKKALGEDGITNLKQRLLGRDHQAGGDHRTGEDHQKGWSEEAV
ncbi:hypothetical protein ANN_08519 [Periplaneta americana]|uniref:Uncharacterized protein n=1 Tax=Periplaneta americana TaxID=6978 RepID=A0ABQ8T2A8_PERAM|nr:hypothetical protein ANN_08519 [Periplaneta americana]